MSSTDRRTDGQTDGRTRWIQYTPPPTSLGRGINSAKIRKINRPWLWSNQFWKWLVRIHHHATLQAIPSMSSPGNAWKTQIWLVSLNQNDAKGKKINRPWPKSNHFWRWSGYISMQKFPPCILWEMRRNLSWRTNRRTNRGKDRQKNGHGWSGGPTDPCIGGKRVFEMDGQPENIMPLAPKGKGIKAEA